jgi:hypothetical protein
MAILNTSDSFNNDAVEMLEGLQQQRSSILDSLVDVHVGLGLLAAAEADRLAQKNAADPRVALLRDRSDATAARVNALSVEQEVATVRTPPPPATGALIQGRVTDTTQRAAGRVTVLLVNEKGQSVAAVDPVDTDDSGYFAFQLKPETVTAIGVTAKLTLLVRNGDIQLVPAAAQPVTIAPGATVAEDLTLSAAELDKLRLRLTVTPGKPDQPVRVDRTTADKEAADKAAAEKVAADKAAADKVAADKAETDKPPPKPRSDTTGGDKP